MREHRFTTPLTEAQVRSLRAGDRVFLDGIIWGIRDATQIHMLDRGNDPPVDLTGAVLLHTAPNVKPVDTGCGWEPVCIGTTTSMRMDRFTEGLLTRYGVRAIVGKGGLSQRSLDLFAEHGGAYLAIVGGAASVQTLQIEAIEAVYFEELMPECLWQLRVKGLGPLTVGMDSQGGSIYRDVHAEATTRLNAAFEKLGIR